MTATSATPTIAFIGAGSVVFTRELLFDILGMPALAGANLRLYDISAERLQTAELMAARVAEQTGARPSVLATLDLGTALDGADFVINAVNVGGHAATLTDFEVPARFGLRQTIADTLGVGGIFRALRTFPVLDEIANGIRAHCPQAWLLNYTNPMAMNVSYLAARHPDVRTLGLCHSVYWTVADMSALLGLSMEGTTYAAAGVNHQAWLVEWNHQGEDVYPLLDAAIATDPELRRRVRVDMYRRIGRYPTETSEHSSEYLPYYLHLDAEIDRLRIPVGVYVDISADNLAEYERTRAELLAGGALVPPDATEYAPQVIHAMTTGEPVTIHANVANHGLIAEVQSDLGVEVPTVIDGAGAHPRVMSGLLPPVGA
ncbi:MAG: alpha-glucosidase/alpha-galactosidase, partial [Nocardioides sp.]